MSSGSDFVNWMVSGKEVSSTPTATYGHGTGGLFSHPALARPIIGAAIEGWRTRRKRRRQKEQAQSGGDMSNYFLSQDMNNLLNGAAAGATVKAAATPLSKDGTPDQAAFLGFVRGDHAEKEAASEPANPTVDFVDFVIGGQSEKTFDETKHPRGAKDTPGGGKFAPKNGGAPKPMNLSQQVDAHAAAAGYVQGKNDFEKPSDLSTDEKAWQKNFQSSSQLRDNGDHLLNYSGERLKKGSKVDWFGMGGEQTGKLTGWKRDDATSHALMHDVYDANLEDAKTGEKHILHHFGQYSPHPSAKK